MDPIHKKFERANLSQHQVFNIEIREVSVKEKLDKRFYDSPIKHFSKYQHVFD